MKLHVYLAVVVALAVVLPGIASADLIFSTGLPDGRMATLSRPDTGGVLETESADDFIFSTATTIDHASFTGLLVGGDVANISGVDVEIYRVFPNDSTVPPSGNVLTRANSPSDVEFASRADGVDMTFAVTDLGNFTVANSVINGVNIAPNQFTGGEGAQRGEEVRFDVTFTSPFVLPADHYFFVPQVAMSSGDFLWLSAPKPIVAPGTPFAPDLQSWIRNGNMAPDWSRVGTDITHQGPFNAVFSLSGPASVPEPSACLLFTLGAPWLLRLRRKKRA